VSKFIDKIAMVVLRGRKMMDSKYNPTSWATPDIKIEAESMVFETLTKYRVGVGFSSFFYAKDLTEANYLKQQFIEEVKNAIYGDLVSKLRDLEQAMYNQDREKSKSLLRDIFREVT